MNIATVDGDFIIDSVEEIVKIINDNAKRTHDNVWISNNSKYPCMGILLNEKMANVHYFLNDDGSVWQSLGNYTEDVEFMINGAPQLISAEYIIPIDKLIDVIKEFCEYGKRPECIEWEEL